MATTVYTEEVIELQDGTEVTLRPLAIGRLRRFMKAWNQFDDASDEEKSLDVFIDCSGIALEKELSDKFDGNVKGTGGKNLAGPYKEYLEDVLDMDTIYKIMEVCGGMKLNDPNLLAAVARMNQEEEAGTN